MSKPRTGKTSRNKETLGERLYRLSKVVASGCWEWQGTRMATGYGTMTVGGEKRKAHRVAYEVFVGPLGDKHVCHRCDNPPCINPYHLFLGTVRDNMEDMRQKGRSHHAPWTKGSGNGRAKLSESDVRWIKVSTDRTGLLAERFGVGKTAIRDIRSGRSWKHV